MDINLNDVRFEAFSGHGAGGQARNRHANCIRAIHLPTGIVAQATSERSMRQNKAAAVALLTARIAARKEQQITQARSQRRASQPPAAFGGHAIRTYRLVGDPGVVDHRTGERFGLDVLQRGRLDPVIRSVIQHDKN